MSTWLGVLADGQCFYCGSTGSEEDRVDAGLQIPACDECRELLQDRRDVRVSERTQYIARTLQRVQEARLEFLSTREGSAEHSRYLRKFVWASMLTTALRGVQVAHMRQPETVEVIYRAVELAREARGLLLAGGSVTTAANGPVFDEDDSVRLSGHVSDPDAAAAKSGLFSGLRLLPTQPPRDTPSSTGRVDVSG